MTKKHEMKLKSFDTADKVLGENEAVWENLAGIAGNRERYHALQESIDTKSATGLSGHNTQVSGEKLELRNKLIDKTLLVVRAYRGTGANTDDEKMRSTFKLTLSDLHKMREITLADTSTFVYNTALPKIDEMSIYIPATELTELKNLTTAYKKSITNPRLEESKSSVTTINIDEIVREMDHIFDLIDDMVAPFEWLNSDFYLAYTSARKQVGMSTRKRKNGDSEQAA